MLPKFIDLHVHTTCSDGTLSPEEVVKLAADEGIKVLAITDHDNVSGIRRAEKEAQKYGITIIPGIECSTTFKGGNRHILGYNIDPDSEFIKQYVEEFKGNRIEKIMKILKNLNALGFEISFEDVQKFSLDGSMGRPHIAQAMVEKGYVKTTAEAFEHYIGKGCIAYASGKHTTPEEVINIIKAAGGIPVLAHPYQMKCKSQSELMKEINYLISIGIEGIECIYPEHSNDESYVLIILAIENNLYVTCGSDFHGKNKTIQIGRCFFNKQKVRIDSLKKMGKTFI